MGKKETKAFYTNFGTSQRAKVLSTNASANES
jgi:hypothetical protein